MASSSSAPPGDVLHMGVPESAPVLVSLKLWLSRDDASTELFDAENLQSFQFFHRSFIREHLKFHCRVVVNHTQKGKRQSIELEGNVGFCHIWVHPSGLAATAVANKEYSPRVAFTLLAEVIEKFLEEKGTRDASGNMGILELQKYTRDTSLKFQTGVELFEKFQDPLKADKIAHIEKELDSVKGSVVQSMDDIMRRGETLDSLMKKSNDLSSTSYQFYKTAKQNNQCCKMY